MPCVVTPGLFSKLQLARNAYGLTADLRQQGNNSPRVGKGKIGAATALVDDLARES